MTKGAPVPPEKMVTRGFHGTDYDYEGEVLPSSKHGKTPHYPDFSGTDDTYFLPATQPSNERKAWGWSGGDGYSDSNDGRGRHRVHVTEPVGEQHIDKNLHYLAPQHDEEWDTYARVAPKQRIVNTAWAPPPDPNNVPSHGGQTHVTQTLGHVNWNQFGGPNYTVHFGSGHAIHDTPSTSSRSLNSYSTETKLGKVVQPKQPKPAPGPKRGPRQVKGQEPLL